MMLALENIRIADFTWAWAGPYCTKMLGDMGAQVIKIESHRHPDIGRMLPPFPKEGLGLNRSGRHNKRNRNKLSITLDLTQGKGQELARKVISISDVVINNYGVRVMKNFGLDYEAVRVMKPDTIYISLAAFGSTGPWKDYIAFGPNQTGVTGIGYVTGYRDSPPIRFEAAVGDPTAGLNGAIAILAALYHRSQTGEGQYIDLSQTEALASLMGQPVMDYVMNTRVQTRQGNRHEFMAPHNFYRCRGRDKWVSIAVGSDEEWQGLCRALRNAGWTDEERFADQWSRWQHQQELDRLLEEWTLQHTHYEVMELLQREGVAAMPALDGMELIADPHLKERGFIVEVGHPEIGKRLIPGVSFKLSDTPGQVYRHAPLLGEHNQFVFGNLLGMSDEEITKLQQEGVIY